jgi:hypothetical protein
MIRRSTTRPGRTARSVVGFIALVVVAGGCSGDEADPVASQDAPPSTTLSPVTAATTSIPPDTAQPEGVDPDVAAAIRDGVTELIVEVEDVRRLPFVIEPRVAILEPEAFGTRWRRLWSERIDTDRLVTEGRLYRLLGLLPTAGGLRNLVLALPPPATVVFYEPAEFRLVVSTDAADLSPVDRSAIVHELLHALVDQHHDIEELLELAATEGRDDQRRALEALAEGDATYFQLLYLQRQPPEDRVEVALAFADTDSPELAALPAFLRSDIAFPFEHGVTFVLDLVETGGIAALDRAYREPPASSEHILHPERYRRGETARRVAPLDVVVDGVEATPSAAYGEQGLRRILSAVIDPGLVTQTADGWGGDAYQLLTAPNGFAFVYALRMESDNDAIEVVEALIAHARTVLELGDGEESGGGLLWETANAYLFVDRAGDGLAYVVSDSPALGAAARDQVVVP